MTNPTSVSTKPAPDMAVEAMQSALDLLESIESDRKARWLLDPTMDKLRAALARPQEVAAPVRTPLSDDEVIAQAKAAGFTYLLPDPDIDGDGAGFPGGFDLEHGLESMRRLLSVGVEQEKPRSLEAAPKDGTIVRLLVMFEEHQLEDREGPQWTIGANSGDNTGEDSWEFAGWSWEQDCFWNGVGKPIGWLPFAGAGGSVGAEPSYAKTKAAFIEELVRKVLVTPDATDDQHLFEFWWAEYMPSATQARAWAAWQAAPQARNVGVAAHQLQAQDAAPVAAGVQGDAARDGIGEKYFELIYAVASKFPGESRHATALRYIRNAEEPKPTEAGASQAGGKGGE